MINIKHIAKGKQLRIIRMMKSYIIFGKSGYLYYKTEIITEGFRMFFIN